MKFENGLLGICGAALLAMICMSFLAGCDQEGGARESVYHQSYLRGAGEGPPYQEICAAGHVYLLFHHGMTKNALSTAPKFLADGRLETCRCEIHGQASGDC